MTPPPSAASPAPLEIDGDRLPQTVWQLAWPVVVTMMLQFLNGIVDMFFVGSVGPAAQAAVGMGTQILMILMSVSMAITSGATAIVARYTGARDADGAADGARQSLLLTLIVSAVVGVPLWFLRDPLLMAMGASEETRALGAAYLVPVTLTVLPYFLLATLIAIAQGLGDMRTPLVIMGSVNVLTILADALLIRGFGPVPALGVTGAGIASSAARVVGALMACAWFTRSGLREAGSTGWRPQRSWFARILNIGYPAALQQVLRNLGSTSYTAVLARTPDGTAAVAALFVGLRAEGLGYMPGVAYGRAATTLVGQSLGAGKPEQAARCGWLCTWQSLSIITALSAVFFAFADPISRWFSQDPQVVALSTSYLRINALGEPFLAFSIVLGGALQGAGDTRFQALVSVITMWLLRLPATYWLCLTLRLGAEAAWWVMAGTTVIQGLLLAAWFRRGSWKRLQV